MEKRKQYKKIEAKQYSELEADYLVKIIDVKYEDSVKDEVLDKDFEKLEAAKLDIYLWALFGKEKGGHRIVCLQVGASINSLKEIKYNIKRMYNKEYSMVDESDTKNITTQFYEKAYCAPKDIFTNKKKDKLNYLYRKIKEDYEELFFCKIDIDKYLAVDDTKIVDDHVKEIFNLSKAYYAETKFAFETQAIYWNAYKSGVGMDTLKRLLSEPTKM